MTAREWSRLRRGLRQTVAHLRQIVAHLRPGNRAETSLAQIERSSGGGTLARQAAFIGADVTEFVEATEAPKREVTGEVAGGWLGNGCHPRETMRGSCCRCRK